MGRPSTSGAGICRGDADPPLACAQWKARLDSGGGVGLDSGHSMHAHTCSPVTRRRFLLAGLAGTGMFWAGCRTATRRVSANEKLNIGVVGVANQGRYNLDNVA